MNRIGVVADGKAKPTHGRRYRPTVVAFAVTAARRCAASAENFSNERLLIYSKPAVMRRLFLRGRQNILKRLLIHVCGFNLGLLMRKLVGSGTPRGLKGVFFLIGSFLKRVASRFQPRLGRLRLNS